MDWTEQRFMDALLQRFDDASSHADSGLCKGLQSVAERHFRGAGRVLGVVGEVVASHVAEVPNDIIALLLGFDWEGYDDVEDECEDDDGGRGISKKESKGVLPSPDSPYVLPTSDNLESPHLRLSPKKTHPEFLFDATLDPCAAHWSPVNTPSSLQRKLEASVYWALKNKRD